MQKTPFKATETLGNLLGDALAFKLSSLSRASTGILTIICSDSSEVARYEQTLRCLCPKTPLKIFRDYETLPYDMMSAHEDIISTRLEFLSSLPNFSKGIVLTSLSAVMQRLCPQDYIEQHSFNISCGDQKNLTELRKSFIDHGYLPVEQVLAHGEFAVRGSLLDIFPMGSDQPLRIDFFDDEADTISYFDVQTQISTKKTDSVHLLPASEFPLDEENISLFRSQYRKAFNGANFQNHTIYQNISSGLLPAGIEYYLPLFFEKTNTFFDYLPENTEIAFIGEIENSVSAFCTDVTHRAEQLHGNPEHPPLPPEVVFLTEEEFFTPLKNKKTYQLLERELSGQERRSRSKKNAHCENVPDIAFDHKDKDSTKKLCAFIEDFCGTRKGRVLITALSEGRRQNLHDHLPQSIIKKFGLKAASSIDDFLEGSDQVMMTIAPFDRGLISTDFTEKNEPLALLTETELLGFKVVRQRKRNKTSQQLDQDAIIKNLAQLTEGQIVVHIDHGIGRYRGLRIQNINGIVGEFLAIEYDQGDILNIPITALNKVARYAGAENPQLSRLSSDAWAKHKSKTAQKVRDVAAELLDICAQRELRPGFAFHIDEQALEEFVSNFPYEETEDQQKAIDETLHDMQQPTAMDRLVCGDVGFGKTEVALRAAFVAAMNGKQVAILAPTTLLVEQHFANFKERFAITPLRVEMLSRFRSTKEQNDVLAGIKNGTVDIVIGTHRLLSDKLNFKDLGLLIIDEEHRFGVRQKEKLKKMRAEVDLLTLTATPIPRTLNMAMEGIRSLSIIASPPEQRLAVRTFVHQDSQEMCKEAILRELRRGGQIYYLHNEVASMRAKAEELQKLVPEARIEIAHGKMNEKDLQRIMQDFCHQRFNILLCSTIIENGLDIPTANTIIIDRADELGLAQLHQIRGRVGRSHHQAYAYLFTPPKQLMTKQAQRRLDAISSINELGAGFVLASHDLEIRGAGELLGEEQSGQICAVGFSLYMDMLNTAVKALREGHEPTLSELSLNECDINMHIPALFPNDYIHDISIRLSLYKRLSSCKTTDELDNLKIEVIDRFGNLPEESENLFRISALKQTADALGIARILGDGRGALIEFAQGKCKVSPKYMIGLAASCKHGEYKIRDANSMRYNLPESESKSRLTLLEAVMRAFYAHKIK